MQLNFKKYGAEGPHIIILHGLFGMLDNWHTIAAVMGNSFQVWTLDQRNHGKSPHTDDMGFKLMAADLDDFIAQTNIPPCFLIGHSMGGKTAMQFAFDYSDKLVKLIVADIGPKGYDASHDHIIEALESVDFTKVSRRADAENMLRTKIKDEGTAQFLLKNLGRNGAQYEWKMNLPAIKNHYAAIIGPVELDKTFDKPTLFIDGGESDYITDNDKPEIIKQFPKAEFITFEGVGHWVHAEAPQLFMTTVIDFINR